MLNIGGSGLERRNGKILYWLFLLLLLAAAWALTSCSNLWLPGNTGAGSTDNATLAVSIPKPPTGVSASDGTYTDKVRVTWATASGATSYEVWRNTSNNSSSASKIGTPSSTSYDDKSATPGPTYYYWVKAKNTAGTSVFSTSDPGWRALAAPTNVQASFDTYTDRIRVTWNSSSGATSYEIWRNTLSNSSSATRIWTSAATVDDDTSATPGTTYYYWVKAKYGNGTSNFSVVSNPGRRPLIPPTNVQASDGTYTDKVRVTWTASNGATSYEVWRYTANNSSSASKIGTPTSTAYDDTSATAGMTYYYWVKAKYSAGTSGLSAPDTGYVARIQTVVVRDALTGKAIVGASVSACDASVCFLPKKTDSSGNAVFTSPIGLRTIDVSASGYVPYTITVSQVAASYTISLKRDTIGNVLLYMTQAIGKDLLPLFQAIMPVKYVGTFTFGQVVNAWGGIALGTHVVCFVDPEPDTKAIACGAAALTWIPSGILWLAHQFGVSDSRKFAFYLVLPPVTPCPFIIAVPA